MEVFGTCSTVFMSNRTSLIATEMMKTLGGNPEIIPRLPGVQLVDLTTVKSTFRNVRRKR